MGNTDLSGVHVTVRKWLITAFSLVYTERLIYESQKRGDS